MNRREFLCTAAAAAARPALPVPDYSIVRICFGRSFVTIKDYARQRLGKATMIAGTVDDSADAQMFSSWLFSRRDDPDDLVKAAACVARPGRGFRVVWAVEDA